MQPRPRKTSTVSTHLQVHINCKVKDSRATIYSPREAKSQGRLKERCVSFPGKGKRINFMNGLLVELRTGGIRWEGKASIGREVWNWGGILGVR